MKTLAQDYIKELWQLVYDLQRGPGSVKTYNSFLHLSVQFDDELLNEISALQTESSPQIEMKLEEIRSRLQIANSTGLIGDKDLDRINVLIDKIIEGVK